MKSAIVKKTQMKAAGLGAVLAALVSLTVSTPARASIPERLPSGWMTLHRWSFASLTFTPDFSRGFDIATIQPVRSLRETYSEDISKIIPADMTPTSDGGLIAAQILDHSLSSWFNSDAVRNSEIGRRAHDVESHMEGDVSFGGSQPDSTKHSFKFAMKATQTSANLEYTGITTAQVSYNIAQSKTNIEVREKLRALNTQLVYNHMASKSDRVQMVSLRWNW